MSHLTIRKESPILLQKEGIQTKIHQGLWTLHSPTEAFVQPLYRNEHKHLWYESSDGHLSVIYHIPAPYIGQLEPVLIIAGPLFHPQICFHKNTPIIHECHSKGQDVYILSHRGHSQSPILSYQDCSLDGIVREDLSAAIRALRQYSQFDSFHWVAQGLGGIMTLIWLQQSGMAAISKLTLINTPIRFSRKNIRFIRKFLGFYGESSKFKHFLKLHLTTPFWNLNQLDRSLLYHSDCIVHNSLLMQICRWMEMGTICNDSGEIDYTHALPKSTTSCPITILSNNAQFYGGDLACYPLAGLQDATWISLQSESMFPLFSESKLLHSDDIF